jgi:hypothetical protein
MKRYKIHSEFWWEYLLEYKEESAKVKLRWTFRKCVMKMKNECG